MVFELYWAEFDHNDIKRETRIMSINKILVVIFLGLFVRLVFNEKD